jgi:hypothetical protein
MNTRLIIISLLMLMFLFGCVTAVIRVHRSKIAERAKIELIGMSKADILSCAGAPVSKDTSGKLEFLSYMSGNKIGKVDKQKNLPGDTRYCEVTFVFENDKVIDILYTGRTGARSSKDEQCAFVVEKCIPGNE